MTGSEKSSWAISACANQLSISGGNRLQVAADLFHIALFPISTKVHFQSTERFSQSESTVSLQLQAAFPQVWLSLAAQLNLDFSLKESEEDLFFIETDQKMRGP